LFAKLADITSKKGTGRRLTRTLIESMQYWSATPKLHRFFIKNTLFTCTHALIYAILEL